MKRMMTNESLVLIACLSLNSNNMDSDETQFIVVLNDERRYVKAESKNHTDHMWQMHMQTLTRRKRSMVIAQTINDAINKYYAEQGKPVLTGVRKILIGG